MGAILAATATAVFAISFILFLKRRRKNGAIGQNKDSVELEMNGLSRKPKSSPHETTSPYLGDRYPNGLIGGAQSLRASEQASRRSREQEYEFYEIDLGEAKRLD